MPPSGKKLPLRPDRPLNDDQGPRIVEPEREMPTFGMTSEQVRAGVRKLMARRGLLG